MRTVSKEEIIGNCISISSYTVSKVISGELEKLSLLPLTREQKMIVVRGMCTACFKMSQEISKLKNSGGDVSEIDGMSFDEFASTAEIFK